MIKLEKNELDILLDLLRDTIERLGNNSCNDYPVDDTTDNRELYDRVLAWANNKSVEDWRKDSNYLPAPEGHLCFYDWMLCEYLRDKIVEQSKEIYNAN